MDLGPVLIQGARIPRAKAYIDDQEAYAANEVSISWNAPLVFPLADTAWDSR